MKAKLTTLAVGILACAAVGAGESFAGSQTKAHKEHVLELGAPFSDGAVLQRDRKVPVWGWAAAGEKVTVSFADQVKSAVADSSGSWRVDLDPMSASSEGRDLLVTTGSPSEQSNKPNKRTVLHDLLVGEVWFCSGQSNMEAPLWNENRHFCDAKGGLRGMMTRKPLVRYCLPPLYKTAETPQRRLSAPAVWRRFVPENLKEMCFSGVGFYFALELHNALGIPVGVVGAYWGGTPIAAWTPDGEIADDDRAKAAKEGRAQPSAIFNAQVAPFAPMAQRGFIWYQGETDGWMGRGYAQKLKALYRGWSRAFESPDLKMRFAQLAPAGGSSLAPVMEGQAAFAKDEPNAEMAVICDRGAVHDWHPVDKETVGMRLAALALRHDYGFTDLKADAPSLKDWKIEGDRFVLVFDNVERWSLYNEDWTGTNYFEIAGADGQWHAARIDNLKVKETRPYASWGAVDGTNLVVSSPEVKEPKQLRHLYRRPFKSNLFNEAGLPLGPLSLDTRPASPDAHWMIVNEDNDHYFKMPSSYMTEEALVRYADTICRGHVTHFFMCPSGQRASFDSKSWEPIWKGADEPDQSGRTNNIWCVNAKLLKDRGIDPYAVWAKRCREKGVSPWMSMRMNDVHYMTISNYFRNTTFCKTRKDLWVGVRPDKVGSVRDWAECSLDYAQEEVRTYSLAHVRELAERYDVDGIELDWMRFGRNLRPGHEKEGVPFLTEFVRNARKVLDAAGARRRRRLKLGVRVCRDPDLALEKMGMDVVLWAKEGLVDLVVPHSFYYADAGLSVREWVDRLHAANPAVRVAPGMDFMSWGGKKSGPMTVANYRWLADLFYRQGAKDVYLFNLPYLSRYASDGAFAKEPVAETVYEEGLSPRAIRDRPRDPVGISHDFP